MRRKEAVSVFRGSRMGRHLLCYSFEIDPRVLLVGVEGEPVSTEDDVRFEGRGKPFDCLHCAGGGALMIVSVSGLD